MGHLFPKGGPTLPMLLRLPPLPSVRDILRIYRIKSKKDLSQNFLMDTRYTQKLVKAAGNLRGHHIWEIGPGAGSVTRPILEKGVANVTVIEKDHRFLPSLQMLEEASYGRMKIVLGDVMDHPMENIFPDEVGTSWDGPPPPCHVISNLPFRMSTPLLRKFLRHCAYRTGVFSLGRVNMVFIFQKEVAERIVSPNQDPNRGSLSVMAQYLFETEFIANIPNYAFVPTPQVDAAIVRFTPRVHPKINAPYDQVLKMVNAVFTFKNKHCKRSISTLFPKDRPDLTYEMCRLAEIDPCLKPTDLSVDDFSRLCHAYEQISSIYRTYTLEMAEEPPRIRDMSEEPPRIRDMSDVT